MNNTTNFEEFREKLYKTLNVVYKAWFITDKGLKSDFKDIFWQFSYQRAMKDPKLQKIFNAFCLKEIERIEKGVPSISQFMRDDSKVLIDKTELLDLIESIDSGDGYKRELKAKYLQNG